MSQKTSAEAFLPPRMNLKALREAAWLMATYHPSAVLRAPDKAGRMRMRAKFAEDLHHAAERLETPVSSGR
jgi:uracil-DNA glycosylase